MISIKGTEVLFTITCVSDISIKYLHIIWDAKSKYQLPFDTNEEIEKIINDYCEELYKEHFDLFIGKLDNANYYLDIAPVESMHNFPWDKRARYLIEQQIETYKPLIQQFILDPDTYPKLKGK